MRLLVLDCELQGLDICQRAARAGHEVQWYRETARPMGKGFDGVRVIDDWRAGMRWCGKDGLVLLTGNAKFLTELDRYRDLGYRIFGPTKASAQLEIDRAKGMEVMKSVGIDLPHYEVFDSLDEAEAFARKSDKAYVLKPMGDQEDKALTFVAHSPADMVGFIQRLKARGFNLKGQCMLQEKVQAVCEIGISGWFGPNGFLPGKYQLCWEFKKLMNDDKGPSTGEMGSVVCYSKDDKMAEEMLLPFTPVLQVLGHRGDFSINCMLDDDGKAWPLEFTARAGWPAFYIQTASHKGDPIQWMSDLLDGKDTLKVDYRPAAGVVMALPPFPQWNGKEEQVCGNPIDGLEDVWSHVHPCMMMIGRGPYMDGDQVKMGNVFQTCGEEPLVVTGLGDTVSAARDAVYKYVKSIRYRDAMFRTDIGACLEEQLQQCHDAGYAESVTWD